MIYQTEWVLPDWVFTVFEPTIWWLTVAIFILLGFYIRKKRQENESASDFLKGIGGFTFLFGIARALENIRRYMISESPSDILDGWIGNAPIISGANMVFRIGYYAVSWTGISMFYYISEKNVFRQKYYFTTAAILEGVFSILMYFGFPDVAMHVLLTLSSIGFLFAAVIPVLLYLKLGYKNPGSLGRASYLTGIGLALFAFGVMSDLPQSAYVVYLTQGGAFLHPFLTSVLAPLVAIAGAIITSYSYQKMFESWEM